MNIAGIIHESLSDGVGVRTVIFISGCKHSCPECHNEKLFNFDYGKELDAGMQDYIINFIKSDKLIDGITISGGDPIYSKEKLINFLKRVKSELPGKTIWLYTGFNFEDIKTYDILDYVDVLVDGKFEVDKKDITLAFRGSSNQRIIDVAQSLKQSKIVLWIHKELS